MLTEDELIEVLKAQLDEAERNMERLAELLRVAYDFGIEEDSSLCSDIEEVFRELKLDL